MRELQKETDMRELQAVAALGSPNAIAEDLLEAQGSTHSMSLGSKVFIGVLLVIGFPLWGVVLALVLLVLSGYVLLWCGPIICVSLTVAALCMGVGSVLGSIAVALQSLALGIMQLGVGLVCLGSVLVLAKLTVALCRIFAALTKWITQWILGYFRKGGNQR